jgi:AraC family transcriptional regulator, transcriptional activator of pobA
MRKYPIYNIQQFNCSSTNSDLYINTFKNHLIDHRFVEEPHRHNSYVLVFFTRGTGTHEIDFEVFSITTGSMFFLQPGQMHHWNLSDDIEGFVIFYSSEIYNLYFGQKTIDEYTFYTSVHNSPEMLFNSAESKAILPYFDSIIAESRGEMMLKQDKIINLLDSIHIEIARKFNEDNVHETHSYNLKIKKFEVLLEKHFKAEKRPSFYASQLHITLKHLNRISKETLKKTTTERITNRIILEAKRMLMDKKMTVNEIATELGYDDYSYFLRLFKKHTAMTPKGFRVFKQ